MSLFAVPMDARTCHFHRTVGYLENGCRKIRISSRMMIMMRRMMMMMLMMMMTRHCEGAAAWRDSPGIWREIPLRGGRGGGSDCRCDVTPAWVVHEPWTGMKLDIHSWTEISGSEKRAPHDCHGWSALSLFKEPFGGILSDTRIVRGEKKTRSVLAQTPKSLLRYLWMLEPVTFIAPLGTGQMDVEKSEWQVERWWWWWWWCWWWWWWWWRDTAKGLLREETH